jgi:hypothetical protein
MIDSQTALCNNGHINNAIGVQQMNINIKSMLKAIAENLKDAQDAVKENEIESLVDSVNDLVHHAICLQKELND